MASIIERRTAQRRKIPDRRTASSDRRKKQIGTLYNQTVIVTREHKKSLNEPRPTHFNKGPVSGQRIFFGRRHEERRKTQRRVVRDRRSV